jgi:PTH2 family peptidyl-tRNA hydrolase
MEERLVKQVIVIRKDLNMRRGKEMSMGSHAALAFLLRNQENIDSILESEVFLAWASTGYTKITLQVDSLEDLQQVANNAELTDVDCYVITDEGRTEFHGVPTITCLALGPDYADKIDQITGNLKLY